jgi:hypothetical protein
MLEEFISSFNPTSDKLYCSSASRALLPVFSRAESLIVDLAMHLFMVLNEVFIEGRESSQLSSHSTNFQFAASAIERRSRVERRKIEKLLNFMSNELNKLNKE